MALAALALAFSRDPYPPDYYHTHPAHRAQPVVRGRSYEIHAQRIPILNPCPCGYFADPVRECSCSRRQVERYRQKISGPLLDRMDLHVEVPLIDFRQLSSREPTESSETVRERVQEGRARQQYRFRDAPGVRVNSDMGPGQVRRHCELDRESSTLLEQAMEQLNFSARAYDRILKVARTVADLDDSDLVRATHLMEAIQYRSLDRKLMP